MSTEQESDDPQRIAYQEWFASVAAGQTTVTLDVYRKWSAYDDNLNWRLQSGDIANLLDEAIEEIDRLRNLLPPPALPAPVPNTKEQNIAFRKDWDARVAEGR